MVYNPERPPEIKTLDELLGYTQRELESISKEQVETIAVELRPISQAPKKPREGMVTYPDGTTYNPSGLGKGPHYFDGTVWKKIAVEPIVVPPLPPTDQAVDWINVKTDPDVSPQAAGDNSTNDTAAINDAIALATSTGRPIYFPKGIYRCTTLNTADGISVFGAGTLHSIIRTTTTTGTVWQLGTGSSGRVVIRDMAFDSVSQRTSGPTLYMLGHLCKVYNCLFQKHYIAIQIEGGSNTVHSCYFNQATKESDAANGGHIFHHTVPTLPGGANNVCHDLIMAAVDAANAPTYGVRCQNGALTLSNSLCVFAKFGVLIDPGSNHVGYALITGNYIDSCVTAGIRVRPTNSAIASGIQIVGNEIASPGDGIQIHRADSARLEVIQILNNWIGGSTNNPVGSSLGVHINVSNDRARTKVMGNIIGNDGFHFTIGVLVSGVSTEFDIIGNEIESASATAIFIDATAQNNYIIALNRIKNGNLTDAGTGVNKIVVNNLGY